mgnify:CR=1 FL=1
MENELGYNSLNTSFTGATSASTELSNDDENTQNDECCNSVCGCHSHD